MSAWGQIIEGIGRVGGTLLDEYAMRRGTLRAPAPAMPGVGAIPGLGRPPGGMGFPRRRRGRGFTSRDIRQTRRMMKLLKEFQALAPRARSHSHKR